MSVSNEPGDVVRVRVSGTTDTLQAKFVQEPDGTTGIEIYYSAGSWAFWRIGRRLVIDVKFPAPRADAPYTYVREFTTSLGMFSHEAGYLAPKVKFGTLSLKGNCHAINIESVSAETATIKTSNSTIKGSFHADEDLKVATSNSTIKGTFSSNGIMSVTTSNSNIEAEVRLFNAAGSTPSKADLATSNSKIKAEVIMTAVDNMGGAFRVDATTSNSKIDLVCTSAPIGSELVLNANTSNSDVDVSLPSAYQGKISASTSNAKAIVESEPPARDPTGLGRQRIVNMIKSEKKSIEGEVNWSGKDDSEAMGKVNVHTSNSKAVIRLK